MGTHLYYVPWGGGSPDTNAYLRAKLKVSVFENGQFSGHLIFAKKLFFRRKNFFYPDKQELCFFEKKQCSFFLKKNLFFGNVFAKNWKKNFDKFFVGRKVLEILKKHIFEKNISKKKIFFSKKWTLFFFQKKKVLVYRGKKFFSPKKKFFCQKLSVR